MASAGRSSRESASPVERAGHGYRNEVTWNGGRGRQPYANQEQEPGETDASGAFREVEGGNRGEHSGVTQEQMERARGTP